MVSPVDNVFLMLQLIALGKKEKKKPFFNRYLDLFPLLFPTHLKHYPLVCSGLLFFLLILYVEFLMLKKNIFGDACFHW